MNLNLFQRLKAATKSKKQYLAQVYVIQRNGDRQVYDEKVCRCILFAYLFCLMVSLEVSDLVNDNVIEIESVVQLIEPAA